MARLNKDDVKREMERLDENGGDDMTDYEYWKTLARELRKPDWVVMNFVADNAEFFGFEDAKK